MAKSQTLRCLVWRYALSVCFRDKGYCGEKHKKKENKILTKFILI